MTSWTMPSRGNDMIGRRQIRLPSASTYVTGRPRALTESSIFAFSPTVSTNLTVWIAAGVVCLAVDDAARRRERGE